MRLRLLAAVALLAVAAVPAAEAGSLGVGATVCFQALPASCAGACVTFENDALPDAACPVVTLPL